MSSGLLGTVLNRLIALVGGSVFGQIMMVLALPIVTRLYEPSDFGVLAAFTSLVLIVLPALCLRYDLAIPIPEDDNEARSLAVLSLGLAGVTSTIVTIFLFLLKDLLPPDLAKVVVEYIFIFPLASFSASIFVVAQNWAIRKRRFKSLALAHASRGIAGAGSQICLGYLGIGAWGLIIGQSVYMGLGSFTLIASFVKSELNKALSISALQFRNVALKHWRFPTFSVPETLLDSTGMHLPLLLIVSVMGVEEAGLLYLAQRILNIPVGIIGGQLSRIFLGEAPNQKRIGNLKGFTLKLMATLFVVSAPFALMGVFVAPWLAESVFGADWIEVSKIIIIFLPVAVLQFCTVPVSTIFHILSKQHILMLVQLIGLLMQVGGVLSGVFFDYIDPVLGLAIGMLLYYATYSGSVVLIAFRRG